MATLIRSSRRRRREHGDAPGPARSYRTPGLDFEVAASDPAAFRLIEGLLHPLAAPTARPQRSYAFERGAEGVGVRCNGRLLCSGVSVPEALGALVADVNAVGIDRFDGLAVHAGVVAAGGGAIAFPAGSGSGKSTLTAACVLAGFSYVSDEALCIDDSGAVHAYPKPLALSEASLRLLGLPARVRSPEEALVALPELGGSIAADALSLRHLVRLRRRPGPAELAPLPAGQGLALLLNMSFNHYKSPAHHFATAARLAAGAACWELAYRDAREAAALLMREVGG